eukprot:gnl/TRDRNA2_/TRDRNA2_123479_c1_seq1.p1 gnl/TRDRNA2_/TRDRNA2_123479_c1~~gnl/TRDRNA2_/TRDRNA2_123479_c1_seq1.p1  ORF type:complete len:189 (-),score=18.86 gnl/TRDRNA2_/TRDRNA2_123479_c1_seq1:83-613(-)
MGSRRTVEEIQYDRQLEKLTESTYLAEKNNGNANQYTREDALIIPSNPLFTSRSHRESLDNYSLRTLDWDVKGHIKSLNHGSKWQAAQKERTLTLVAKLQCAFVFNSTQATNDLLPILDDAEVQPEQARWALRQVADFHSSDQLWHWNEKKYTQHRQRLKGDSLATVDIPMPMHSR